MSRDLTSSGAGETEVQETYSLAGWVIGREDMMPIISGQNQTTENQASYRGSVHTKHVTPRGLHWGEHSSPGSVD